MSSAKECLDVILIVVGVFAFYQFLGLTLGNSNPVDVVVSSSMHPNLYEGDLVICAKDEPKLNDIVIYTKDQKYPIIHRVIGINDSYCRGENPWKIKIEGKTCYTIKGDNNKIADPPVRGDQIICVVKLKVPYLGYPRYLIYKLIGI